MKKYFLIPLFLFLSCQPPTAPVDDPNDPTSFTPKVEITEGPQDNTSSQNRTVKFSWKGNSTETGIKITTEFQFKIKTEDPSTDVWSNWDSSTTFLFEYLDDDKFTFDLKGRTAAGSESDVVSRKFTIDTLPSPAVAIFPVQKFVAKDNSFDLYLHLKNVNALMSMHTIIKYDPTKISVLSVDTVNYFAKKNKGTFFTIIDSINTGRIIVDLGIAMGSPKGLSGAGRILKLKCKNISDNLNTTVEILSAETIARDTSNQTISLKAFAKSTILGK
ncbi:MAG: hypothetical protein O3A55_07480 [Bacteroidetes bacterium]|nr:hypothetical protein [Bacteroidota bacterium]